MDIVIYTDGACSGNPGPAGAGIVMVCGKFRKEMSVFLGEGTNNIAELTAIKIALKTIKRKNCSVTIFTDSNYAQGVLNQTLQAHKNQALIQEIRTLIQSIQSVTILKVAAHTGIKENEKADSLAALAIQKKQSSTSEYKEP